METAMTLESTEPISVKFSALLGLRRALLEERYEECSRWISLAMRRGAEVLEIRSILQHPLEGLEGR